MRIVRILEDVAAGLEALKPILVRIVMFVVFVYGLWAVFFQLIGRH